MSDLSAQRIAELFAAADAATDTDEVGKALEEVVVHVLQAVPGVQVVSRRHLNNAGSEEIDVGVLNHQRGDGLALFEPLFFVECKNWSKPVDASTVRDFEGKLRSRGRSFGVLVASHGISGDSGELKNANEVVAGALRDHIEIVVITREQLCAVRTVRDFIELLLRRRTALIMTQTVSDDDWAEAPSTIPEDEERLADAPAADARGGFASVADALRQERERRVRDMASRMPDLPEDESDAVQLVVDAINRLVNAISQAVPDDHDTGWQTVLDCMLDCGGVALAFFERARGAVPEADVLAAEALHHAPNIRHVTVGSRLFSDLVSYYGVEVTNAEDMPSEDASLGLVGLLMEGHWRLDDSIRQARLDEEPGIA